MIFSNAAISGSGGTGCCTGGFTAMAGVLE